MSTYLLVLMLMPFGSTAPDQVPVAFFSDKKTCALVADALTMRRAPALIMATCIKIN